MSNNTDPKIQEIIERLEAVPLLIARFGTDGHISVSYDYERDVSYLLSEYKRLQTALEWTKERYEEEWTNEPGIGEVVEEIIGRFAR
ncbi:hypothetical protein D3C75_282000 [compost metagenome]